METNISVSFNEMQRFFNECHISPFTPLLLQFTVKLALTPVRGLWIRSLRPYPSIFKATVVPVMRCLGIIQLQGVFDLAERKASVKIYCQFLHRWPCQQHHYLSCSSTNSFCDTLWNVLLRKLCNLELFSCSLWNWETQNESIQII